MPQLELKTVQRELDQGLIWPFYWIYGQEKFKFREILKRIRSTVLGEEATQGHQLLWNEEVLEGSETHVEAVLDSVRSPVLGGGIKFIVVRDAHVLKNLENFAELLGPAQQKSELNAVCVCLAKDLDGRKKFSKTLLEKAAVVPCEEVSEAQKESWIQYLAKRRNIVLNSDLLMSLCALDPWSLDIVDQELEKFSVAGLDADVVLQQDPTFGTLGGADAFLESFFSRNLKSALSQVNSFAGSPEDALPLLGLLGWNTRQLALLISDRERGTRYAKMSPYLADKFRRWSHQWRLLEVIELQSELSQVDFSLKQTPLLPLGLWTELVTRFCKNTTQN